MTDETIEQQAFDTLWAVQLSSRYHMRRQAFFERWSRVTAATGVLFGSTAIAGAFTAAHMPAWITAVTGAMVAVASTVDLVVGTAMMARKHEDLRKRFLQLEAEIRRCMEPTAETCVLWTDKRLAIEFDEPPIYNGLALLCYDELARATRGVKERVRVLPSVRITAQWWRWDRPVEELIA
ncbi:hypothetical protein ACFWZ4_13055 [Frateuria sp. GZRe12]|uniref:hypothetical protein n=1 Tax=Frateuria sp. GZRe12 TaxID=3351533 RepID=UPI003EDC08A1